LSGLRGVGCAIYEYKLSYPNLILTCPRSNLLLQTRLCSPIYGGITVSSILEEMPEYNQPVWRRKVINLTARLAYRETSNLVWGNFEYLQVSDTTAGKN